MSLISNISAQTFNDLKEEDMNLLHHAAFDGKYEMVEELTKLPYFQEIIDDNSNHVSSYIFHVFSLAGLLSYMQLQKRI